MLGLSGDVPRATTFAFEYSIAGSAYRRIALCGSDTGVACYGAHTDGRSYCQVLPRWRRGRTAQFRLVRIAVGRRDVIERGLLKFAADRSRPKGLTLTARLHLAGDVPEGTTFRVFWDDWPDNGGSSPLPIYLCGQLAKTDCEGGSRIFTYTLSVLYGKTIDYGFIRLGAVRGDYEGFAHGRITQYHDATISARLSFPGGDDSQRNLPGMPHIYAGGMGVSK